MEVALLPRFLDSMILFSLTSNFEKNLKTELWLCHFNMKLSMEDLYNMTVADRKSYIVIHNKQMEKEKEKLDKIRHKN
jgi:hypothetical protein